MPIRELATWAWAKNSRSGRHFLTKEPFASTNKQGQLIGDRGRAAAPTAIAGAGFQFRAASCTRFLLACDHQRQGASGIVPAIDSPTFEQSGDTV